jgi:hypothetical protein
VVNSATLVAQQLPPSSDELALGAARRAASSDRDPKANPGAESAAGDAPATPTGAAAQPSPTAPTASGH